MNEAIKVGTEAHLKIEQNHKKWNNVFVNYEQYKLKQAKNEEDILPLTQWLMLRYRPVKLYFRKTRKDSKSNG